MTDVVRKIADAVLYEGYVLWPYRRSAHKNQQRWTFGCVVPPAWSATRPDERDELRCECLVEGGDEPRMDVRARFLQVVRRQVVDAEDRRVDELVSNGERHLTWEEATEREVGPGAFSIPGGAEREPLEGGALVRSWRTLEGELTVGLERETPELTRITARIVNRTPWEGDTRADAVESGFCSTHLVLRVEGGDFVSPLDERAAACAQEGLWPTLVGETPDRSTVLAAPIILEEYPRVAPESPGDLFDGGEIDELLSLSILGLSDQEKEEMRASDPKTRAILERTEAMTADDLMRLHGVIREFRIPGRR